jgi:predicted PurR-regulated permease PerM
MTENRYVYPRVWKYIQLTALILFFLYFGRTLFIPLSFGLLLAIISYPACKWLEARGWPMGLAVGTLLFLIIVIFISLLWLLAYEANLFVSEIPKVTEKIMFYMTEARSWLAFRFGVGQETQNNFFQRIIFSVEKSMSGSIGETLVATTSTILTLILIPIFGALFLLHRKTFVQFFLLVAGKDNEQKFKLILKQSITTYFKFVKGTFLVYCIVGVLNSVGLLLLGIEHAILFGIITAFMTIIPYIGIFISAALPVSIALITKDSIWYAIGVISVFSIVQYLEANVIFPRVVGEQLNLSTWAVLVAIIVGTILWGISGMILFIPFTAILKIFSDHIDELKPLNILLNRSIR